MVSREFSLKVHFEGTVCLIQNPKTVHIQLSFSLWYLVLSDASVWWLVRGSLLCYPVWYACSMQAGV